MPIPVKPCEGRFNDEVLAALSVNRDRFQWALHTCEVCGASVGAVQLKGLWVPEQHWPTVKSRTRIMNEKKQKVADETAAAIEIAAADEVGILAESTR